MVILGFKVRQWRVGLLELLQAAVEAILASYGSVRLKVKLPVAANNGQLTEL